MREFTPRYAELNPDIYYLSAAAHQLLLLEFARNNEVLKKKKEDSAVDSGDEAQHHNEALLHAIEDMGIQQSIVAHLKNNTERVQIVEPNKQTEFVDFGNTVVVKISGETSTETLTILGGYHDNSIDERRISYKTPLAQAILGKKVGEKAEYKAGSEVFTVKVIEIRAGEF